jgi:deoxyribonuclease V
LAASFAPWPGSAEELVAAQRRLADARPPPWRPAGAVAIGGCFVCFAGERAWAAAAIGEATAVVAGTAGGPYQPGLLALREGPLLEAAVRALPRRPDVLIVNATGRDHPRRAGLALQLGAVLELPTVGVTHRPLGYPEEVRWLTTKPGTRPVAVHAAWRTDLETAVDVVSAALAGFRTPEPIRRARRAARRARSLSAER